MSSQVNYRNFTAVIAQFRMVDESDLIAFGRESRTADPAARDEQFFPGRIFQSVMLPCVSDNRETRTVGRPSHCRSIRKHPSWRAAVDRCHGERSCIRPANNPALVHHNGNLSRGGNCRDFCVFQAKRKRSARFVARREKLWWSTFPICRVNDGMPVRSKES